MNLRKLILAGTAAAAVLGVPAQASIIDNPQFRVLGLVIVWGADAADSGTPIVSDFIIGDVAGGTDLIDTDVHAVVTGTLLSAPATAPTGGEFEITGAVGGTGVLDATAAAFGAFTLDDTTDVSLGDDLTQRSSFYVASNTAFNISADASLVGTPVNFALSDVGYELSITENGTGDGLDFGSEAQLPHTGNTATSGVLTTATTTLADLTGGNVFEGNRLTAATPGSIAEQSVRFDAVYTLGGSAGYDLSDGSGEIETQVEYTVFVP